MLSHLSCVQLCNPKNYSPQVLLSMEFSWQEYWSGLPFPPPGDLPNPGIECMFLRMLNRYIIVDWVFLGISILDYKPASHLFLVSVFPSLDDSAGFSQRLVNDDQRQKLFPVSYPVLCILGFTCSQVAFMLSCS